MALRFLPGMKIDFVIYFVSLKYLSRSSQFQKITIANILTLNKQNVTSSF